jgi:hypothetical protein
MSGSVEPAIAGGKDWRAPWRRAGGCAGLPEVIGLIG